MLGKLACPWCGAAVDEHDGADPDRRPKPGDASVCFECLRIGVFVNTVATGYGRVALAIRRATDDEAADFRRDPELAAMIELAQRDRLRRVRGADDAAWWVGRWRDELLLRAPVPLPYRGSLTDR